MQLPSDVFRRQRWSVRFANPGVEDAFLATKQSALFQNISRSAIMCGAVFAPQVALRLYTKATGVELYRQSAPGDSYLVVMCGMVILSLSLAVLMRLQRVQRFLGYRGAEVIILAIMAGFLWFVVVAYGMMTEKDSDSDDAQRYRACVMALALDTMITIAHLALPARWFVMVWMEAAYLVAYATFSLAVPGSFDVASLGCICGLVIGASVGLRSQEQKERILFATIVDERTLRARAEFAAHTAAEGASPERHKSPSDTKSSKTSLSVPSTSRTGRIFAELDQNADAGEDARQEMLDLGRAEKWLVDQGEVAVNYERVVGVGGQACVYEAQFCSGPVVVKKYKARLKGKETLPVFNELRILRHVRHPNIALFHGAWVDDPDEGGAVGVALVLEMAAGVQLDIFFARMQQSRRYSKPRHLLARQKTMQGVCRALIYIHSRSPAIVHGDVSPGNVLVESREGGAFAKLIDFGLSKAVTRNARPLKGGTKHYAAPEACRGSKAMPQADVFSLGRMLYHVANGEAHVSSSAARAQNPGGGWCTWESCSELLLEWRPCIQLCTSRDPSVRPRVVEVYQQLFLVAPAHLFPMGEESEHATAEASDRSSLASMGSLRL